MTGKQAPKSGFEQPFPFRKKDFLQTQTARAAPPWAAADRQKLNGR